MRSPKTTRVAVVTLLVAIVAVCAVEAISRSRLPPAPTKRSRAHDTPVRDHVAGGGPFGGDVLSLAVTRSTPAAAFVALFGGGIYRSTDRGESWQPADRGLPESAYCVLTADPSSGDTLFAACDDGLFTTTDGGALWRQLDVDNADAPVVSPADPRVLYVGDLRSRDGGAHWSYVTSPRRRTPCGGDVVADTRDANRLYCIGEDGLFTSRNGGRRWTAARLPQTGRPASVLMARDRPGELLVSTDTGAILVHTLRDRAWTPRGQAIDVVPVDDLKSDDSGTYVYGRQGEHLVRSADGGRTWRTSSVAWPPFALKSFAFEPADPRVVYAATSDGPYVSTDAGDTWRRRVQGLTGAPATVAVHEGVGTTLFAAVGVDVVTSADDGRTWVPIEDAPFTTAIDVRSLGSDGAGGVLLRAAGRRWRLAAGATRWSDDATPGGVASMDRRVTPHGQLRLAEAAGRFHYTQDGGTTWQTGSFPSGVMPSGVASVERDPTHLLAAVGGIPAMAHKLRSSLWRSRDGGASWTLAMTPETHVTTWCCDVLVDPHDGRTLYAVLTGMVIGGGGAQVLRSTDAGDTWMPAGFLDGAVTLVPTTPTTLLGQGMERVMRSIDGGATWVASHVGLPSGVHATGFAFDRRRPSTVFAATAERGLYRSDDGGASWTPTGHETRPASPPRPAQR